MSDFGKAQLLKYGWSEGKGLGKNENGVTEAIKPKIKNNTAGVGFKDVQTTWLDDFMSGKSTSEFQQMYEEKKPNSRKRSKKEFLKSSTLENGVLIEDETNRHLFEEAEKEESAKKSFQMSDEELFKVCGGRTLHKGARHNIGMSGKLARIQQAEEELLAKMKKKTAEDIAESEQKVSKKKKKQSKTHKC